MVFVQIESQSINYIGKRCLCAVLLSKSGLVLIDEVVHI